MKRLTLLLVIIVLAYASACRPDEDRVPNVPVDIFLALNNPSYINLSIIGGWEYIQGGSRGILIYRAGAEEFVAFDRHCSYDVPSQHRVLVNSTNIIAADSLNCGSQFVITDGSVTQGPAQFPLTQYRTTYDPALNTLRITN